MEEQRQGPQGFIFEKCPFSSESTKMTKELQLLTLVVRFREVSALERMEEND